MTPRVTRHYAGLTIVALLAIFLSACSSANGPSANAETAPEAVSSTASATKPSKSAIRVTDLMAKAGCKGSKIDTQMYAKETARCTLTGGGEVTIAVFDSLALRDQWVAFAQGIGGNYAAGDGWAASASDAKDAQTIAKKLSGDVL